MKSVILFLSVVAFGACSQSSTYQPKSADTSRSIVMYYGAVNNTPQILIDEVIRITKDSVTLDSTGPNTFAKHTRRDSIYYAPVLLDAVDSTGKPLKDSSGQPVKTRNYQLINKRQVLQDYNKSF